MKPKRPKRFANLEKVARPPALDQEVEHIKALAARK